MERNKIRVRTVGGGRVVGILYLYYFSVFYCYLTNFPKQWFGKTSICNLSCYSQESRLVWILWVWACSMLPSKCSWELQASPVLPRGDLPLSPLTGIWQDLVSSCSVEWMPPFSTHHSLECSLSSLPHEPLWNSSPCNNWLLLQQMSKKDRNQSHLLI